ncbi:MAG: 2-oxo acid dehydrogenase subunit E2 [Actinobacteria bacterium]|nr:2-oxo acid dehydrogenase subunit E2 [Actinomycetota bacterium]
MSDIKQFRLPDAGEGLTEADIVHWKVAVGDTVKVNDPIVEIETAKSLVELPCPFAGVVTALLVDEGATVEVGTPIIAVDTAPGSAGPAPSVEPVAGANGRTAVLVGYGPRTTSAARRPRRAAAAPQQPVTVTPEPVAAQQEPVAAQQEPGAAQPAPAHALAKPPVRLLAKQLGVDLTTLAPSGPGGVVTREDVEQAAHPAGPASGVATQRVTAAERETRIPVKGVRKLTADAMVTSAFTAPHVTEWVQVDVSRTMKLVDRLRADPSFEGVRVGPLLLVATALLVAVQRYPEINATWDEAAREIVVKHYVNLGIAAATPRGLVVPNVKDADRLGLRDLAVALNALAATAREGRTPPADLAGGTVTITNVGVFGVDAGTPILNPGEAAILAVGQIRRMPWVHKGKVRPRWVTTLALSFDHRMVDGDLGSRAHAEVAALLEDPVRAHW